MSIASEVERISANVRNTIDAIEQTGVTVPEGATSDNLPALARALANEKQNKLTGTQGQVVGFDSSGNAVAQAAPSGLPEGGAQGQLLAKGASGAEWVDNPTLAFGPPSRAYDSMGKRFHLSGLSIPGFNRASWRHSESHPKCEFYLLGRSFREAFACLRVL